MAAPTELVRWDDERRRRGLSIEPTGTIMVNGKPMPYWLPVGWVFVPGRNGETGRVVESSAVRRGVAHG